MEYMERYVSESMVVQTSPVIKCSTDVLYFFNVLTQHLNRPVFALIELLSVLYHTNKNTITEQQLTF